MHCNNYINNYAAINCNERPRSYKFVSSNDLQPEGSFFAEDLVHTIFHPF